ncbi:cadherin-related family member 5 [Dugong dugon]
MSPLCAPSQAIEAALTGEEGTSTLLLAQSQPSNSPPGPGPSPSPTPPVPTPAHGTPKAAFRASVSGVSRVPAGDSAHPGPPSAAQLTGWQEPPWRRPVVKDHKVGRCLAGAKVARQEMRLCWQAVQRVLTPSAWKEAAVARMGEGARLWPPLLLPLLLVELLGRAPGARAQACSVNRTFMEIKENENVTKPLVDIYVPEDQQVTLGSSSTPSTFQIRNNQLFLIVIPDYETSSLLQADLECRRGDTVVTQLRVFVSVLDVNDNPPIFPFTTKVVNVSEDTKVNSIVIPETDLKAQDGDRDDILFYTLQEVTPGANDFFSLVGMNRPALRLDKQLDFYSNQNMTFQLLVRDTEQENVVPSHTATATLTLNVLPADLRPPWFLPCAYSDNYICIQAQYQGAIAIGQIPPDPLTLSPGPIYAVDGDRGIDQPIIYSILDGNQAGVFAINESSGNLTMVLDVPNPTTFVLLVKGEQADLARYSVTQVSLEARADPGSPPIFSQSLYRGSVALGSGADTVVKDAATPSQLLRIRAQNLDSSVLRYRITNHSYFSMEGEVLLTTVALANVTVFYAEVEAKNTMTSLTATTVVEIQVREEETLPPGPPSTPPSSEAGRTTGPSSSAPSEGTRPPGPSQGPSGGAPSEGTRPPGPSQGPSGGAPSEGTRPPGPSQGPSGGAPSEGTRPPGPSQGPSGGAPSEGTRPPGPSQGPSGGAPSEGTRPPGPSQGPSGSGTSEGTRPPGPSQGPSGGAPSEGTRPPGPSQGPPTTSSAGGTGPHPPSDTTLRPPASPTPGGSPSAGASTSPSLATPSSGGSAPTLEPGASQLISPWPSSTPGSSGVPGGEGGSTAGDSNPGGGLAEDRRFSVTEMAVLGGVLGALLLLALLALTVLIYRNYGHRLKGRSGKALEPQSGGFDNQAFTADNEAESAPASSPAPGPAPAPEDEPPAPPNHAPPSPVSPAAARVEGSPTAVRSILTKERRPEGGYKAVWFGEDIGAETDVVLLNGPTADGAGDSGSESGGDEDADPALAGGPVDAPDTDSTFI